ncbi:F0F1 ATP synthase subunit B [Lactovum miscens]|uniref:ATP synthase subunit b n=1 Tax=Lactovum miscens TaxID=190387 RepID=A0A841C8C4_9LACT|nr:F0F1 ATP synthase subunit B [Lactovum miscens]MBB5887480.1 F-type H+-transporting ATPase subunit b [Lactovum miscens]
MILAETAPNTILGNIIVVSGAFILLIVLLRLFAWKQITGVFEARAKKITDDISAAEDAQKEASELVNQRQEELSHTREEASEIVETARITAAQTRQSLLEQAMTDVTKQKQRATDDIANQRIAAMNTVRGEVAAISVQIAETLIGKSLDTKGQSELIDSYLNKFGE